MSNTAHTMPNFTPFFTWVHRATGDRTTTLVYGVVWRFCQMRKGVCYASVQRIAAEVGLSQRSTFRALARLCGAGLLHKRTRGQGLTCVYALARRPPAPSEEAETYTDDEGYDEYLDDEACPQDDAYLDDDAYLGSEASTENEAPYWPPSARRPDWAAAPPMANVAPSPVAWPERPLAGLATPPDRVAYPTTANPTRPSTTLAPLPDRMTPPSATVAPPPDRMAPPFATLAPPPDGMAPRSSAYPSGDDTVSPPTDILSGGMARVSSAMATVTPTPARVTDPPLPPWQRKREEKRADSTRSIRRYDRPPAKGDPPDRCSSLERIKVVLEKMYPGEEVCERQLEREATPPARAAASARGRPPRF